MFPTVSRLLEPVNGIASAAVADSLGLQIPIYNLIEFKVSTLANVRLHRSTNLLWLTRNIPQLTEESKILLSVLLTF